MYTGKMNGITCCCHQSGNHWMPKHMGPRHIFSNEHMLRFCNLVLPLVDQRLGTTVFSLKFCYVCSSRRLMFRTLSENFQETLITAWLCFATVPMSAFSRVGADPWCCSLDGSWPHLRLSSVDSLAPRQAGEDLPPHGRC